MAEDEVEAQVVEGARRCSRKAEVGQLDAGGVEEQADPPD